MTALVERGAPGSWTGAIFNSDTQSTAASGAIKDGPAVFYEVNGYNASGSTRYFQIFDSATVPADGVVPACVPVVVPPYGVFSLSFAQGLFLATGLSWASSSGLATKTVTGADLWVTITYK